MTHALRLLFVAPLPLFIEGGGSALTAAPSVADACDLLAGGAVFDALLLDADASRCSTQDVAYVATNPNTARITIFAASSSGVMRAI